MPASKEAGMAKPTDKLPEPPGASSWQAAFIGSDLTHATAGFLARGSLRCRAFSRAAVSGASRNGVCGPLPAHSDRIAREFHPVPYYPPKEH